MASQWVTNLGNVSVILPIAWSPLSGPAAGALAANGARILGVRAVDFGQGDCNAIMSNDGAGNIHPVVYFDMGGGCGKCARTHRHHPGSGHAEAGWANLPGRIDDTLSPKVILSHWDKDHYFSATKAVGKSQALHWLAPRQRIGPACAAFVAGIANINCFPTNAGGAIRYTLCTTGNRVDLYVEQATNTNSPDRNLNGLVCTLVKLSVFGADDARIIMPADAPFQFVDSLVNGNGPGGDIRAIFAFHHGARTHFGNVTSNAMPNPPAGNLLGIVPNHNIVFTYGLSPANTNGYGHPNAYAVGMYLVKGWLQRQNTASTQPNSTFAATLGHNVATRSDQDIAF